MRNRLWSWIYVRATGPESGAMLVLGLAIQIFVAFGAFVLGIERIRGRESAKLRPIVKPDEVLVENYGPKGEKWK